MKKPHYILPFLTIFSLLLLASCQPHSTSPQSSLQGDGVACRTLVGIDSLMWQQPDSALAVMTEFAASPEADSLDEFEGHYCQLLIAELLFKNDCAQSNRTEVLKAVSYFDSLVMANEADARGASLQGPGRRDASKCEAFDVVNASDKTMAFLDARTHYINGAGYYERDSLVEACTEYLNTLRIMETHFPEIETQNFASLRVEHLPRFMALTYGRLCDLLTEQFMTEFAIVCYKKCLVFSLIEPTSATGIARVLALLGQQYDILKQTDNAGYYYNEAFKYLPDTNNLVYRDLISGLAVYNYYSGKGVEPAVCDLKRMATQTTDEDERLTRYFTIGSIYFENSQYDSALVYLLPVFENKDNVSFKRDASKSLRDIFQIKGDSLKAAQYARYQVENPVHEGESNRRVSQLNDLFQTYLQEKQEAASLRERRKAVRLTLMVLVPLLLVIGLAVVIVMRRRHRKRLTAQQMEAQQRLEKERQSHRKEQAALSGRLERSNEELRNLQSEVEQNALHKREILQQRVADIYQSNTKNRLQRILEALDDTYPQIAEKLKSAYPELSETERNILLLNFLHFRIKEEADLLGLSENSIAKYRSNLGKTIGKDPIPDWV